MLRRGDNSPFRGLNRGDIGAIWWEDIQHVINRLINGLMEDYPYIRR